MDISQAFSSSVRMLYIVCQDETHALRVVEKEVQNTLQKLRSLRLKAGSNPTMTIRVHNMAWGIRLLSEVYDEWRSGQDIVVPSTLGLNQAISWFYKFRNTANPHLNTAPPPTTSPEEDAVEDDGLPKPEQKQQQQKPLSVKTTVVRDFLVVLDADRHFNPSTIDPIAIRRIKNLYNQQVRNPECKKTIIFVGKSPVIPDSLAEAIEVVDLDPISPEEVRSAIAKLSPVVEVQPPKDMKPFLNLTLGQVQSSFFRQMFLARRGEPFNPKALDEVYHDLLRQTGGLLKILHPKETFDSVGGLDRFKAWVDFVAPVWTPEGTAAGLEVPKGVLCVGVWGTGKSMAIKCMANAWGLPLFQLEFGKLRGGLIGSSENNLYRVLKVLDRIGDCVVLVDEADKGLSGSASSHNTDGGVGLRMLGIFSTWLQDTSSRVCFGFTSNTVNTIPTEFINRLDYRFFFDVPTGEELGHVLRALLKTQGWQIDNVSPLVEAAEGLVSREIAQTLKESKLEAFHLGMSSPSSSLLAKALARRPRITETKMEEIQELKTWVSYDPERQEGRNALLASSPSTPKKPKFEVL